MSAPGRLYLVPVPIYGAEPASDLAPRVVAAVRSVSYFIVENERSARRVLSRLLDGEAMDRASFAVLDEHTPAADLPGLLAPIVAGADGALLSEAGSPCVADPGTELVALAHGLGVRPVALPGPSSILLALMASGLGGQAFSFRGYLPPEARAREDALREAERASARDGSTQVFIETPYRNDAMAASAAKALRPATLFCVASGLTGPDERIIRMEASEWGKSAPAIGKVPAIFLLKAARETASEARRDGPSGPAKRGRPRGPGAGGAPGGRRPGAPLGGRAGGRASRQSGESPKRRGGGA